MKILLTISFLFSVATAQIKADGITDDLPALKAWARAGGKTPLPETKIRITDSWVVGGDVLSYDNLFKKEYNLKLTEYQSAKYAKAIAIKNAVIWLDNPDTTKAVIIYNAQGLLDDNNAGLIENVTLIGKGIGIYSAYTKGLRLHNINFKGFKNGLILNNAYFFDCQNLRFENCDRAEYDIRSHRGNFSNITVAGCKKGFEIRSNQIIVNGYYASQCNTGLHVAAGNNELRSVYLETLKTDGQIAAIKIGLTQAVKFAPEPFCREGLWVLTAAGYGAALWNIGVMAGSGLAAIPFIATLMIWQNDEWYISSIETCKNPWEVQSFSILSSFNDY